MKPCRCRTVGRDHRVLQRVVAASLMGSFSFWLGGGFADGVLLFLAGGTGRSRVPSSPSYCAFVRCARNILATTGRPGLPSFPTTLAVSHGVNRMDRRDFVAATGATVLAASAATADAPPPSFKVIDTHL